jgi:uncharacterized protein
MDWQASILGLGVMHLPSSGKATGEFDGPETIKIIRYAIDHGVNYLDLGLPYDLSVHEKRSRLFGRALGDGYREKIKITATLPSLLIQQVSDCDRFLTQQLEWLQTGTIDFFLFGALDRYTWPRLQALGVLKWAEEAIAAEKIEHIGFAFHDYFQTLRDILKAYDRWTLGQFQFSYMDVDHHPGISGIQYAARQGLAVVITEPLRGGRLTKDPPMPVAQVWESAPVKRSLAEWGLRWVWNYPEISTAVCDVSTMQQLKEDLALADIVEPEGLTIEEEVLISRVREAYQKMRPIPCTACRSCMPCPQDVDAPRIFELYNDAVIYNDIPTARSLYNIEKHCIDDCNECGICIKTCGREIDIPQWLKEARKTLVERS